MRTIARSLLIGVIFFYGFAIIACCAITTMETNTKIEKKEVVDDG